MIEAGDRSAEIAIPLIDDDQAEADEDVTLFYSIDPSIASSDARKVTATIVDNDS